MKIYVYLGGAGVGGIWPLLCLNGEPTHNFTNSANNSASARPKRDDPLKSGFICLI